MTVDDSQLPILSIKYYKGGTNAGNANGKGWFLDISVINNSATVNISVPNDLIITILTAFIRKLPKIKFNQNLICLGSKCPLIFKGLLQLLVPFSIYYSAAGL